MHFHTRLRTWLHKQRTRVAVYGCIVGVSGGGCTFMTQMPGRSYRGSPAQADLVLGAALQRDVEALATGIGERSTSRPGTLGKAAAHLRARLRELGYEPVEHRYDAGVESINLEGVLPGADGVRESVVIGAHYDSAVSAPGADDNASGVAVVLALASHFRTRTPALPRSLRFVLFANEEPPHFWNPTMGSLVFAKACRARGDAISAMLSIESVGYYRDEDGTQRYPAPLNLVYPSRGNFVGFVGNLASRSLLRDVVRTFRAHAEIPSDGAALPGFIPGVGWSDHWSFWEVGYPAVMVTDTATFRNPHYHTPGDRPETLDYPRMAALTRGLIPVIERLAGR